MTPEIMKIAWCCWQETSSYGWTSIATELKTLCVRENRNITYTLFLSLDMFYMIAVLICLLLDFSMSYYSHFFLICYKTVKGNILRVLLFFDQFCPGADTGQGQNMSWGFPSVRNLFFRPIGYSSKPNAKRWSRSMWDEELFWFHSEVQFLTHFWLSLFAKFDAISIEFVFGKVHYLHLFCVISIFIRWRRLI